MTVTIETYSEVNSTSQTYNLSSLVNVTPGSDPAYLVVTAIDRNEYTATASDATGHFTGNGHTDNFTQLSGNDFRVASILFTYNSTTGQYTNATYGNLSSLTYTSSASPYDITQIAIYGTNSAAEVANAITYANPLTAQIYMPQDYIGSATISTQVGFSGTVPSQATPSSIEAAARTMIGLVWNDEGCWPLAETIAAKAGTALSPTTITDSITGAGNGEWFVAFDGTIPANANANWQSYVTAGEIITIPGHILTVVSGSGASALVVDNAATSSNSAKDGNLNDIIIEAPHGLSSETANLTPSQFVIYELDCPVITANALTGKVTSLSLASAFSAVDPNHTAITEYQVYDLVAGDKFSVSGQSVAAISSATACTVSSLSAISFVGTGIADTIEVRAENSLGYWGDWVALGVNGGSSTTTTTTTPQAPVGTALAAQTWKQGQAVDFTLPSGTFIDPNGQALTYSAKLSNGSALPSWLSINSTTGEITGTAPSSSNLSIVITATDTSSLSVSETMAVTVISAPTAPIIATQTWKQGAAVSFVVPAFTDPNNQTLTYTATQADGSALPSWLKFNAAAHTLTGTPPSGAASLSIEVTATDTSGLSSSDTFAVDVLDAPVVTAGSFQRQTSLAGKAVELGLPTGTFTDPNGETLTYSAKLANGAMPSWMHVNPATGEITGTAPSTITNMTIIETAKDTSGLTASANIAVTGIRAPTVAHHEANQTFKQGQTVNLSLSLEFADPQHQTLTYTATEKDGSALPSWLSFNTANDTFTGTVPATAGTIGIVVTATDTSGLSITDAFNLTTIAAPVVQNQTSNVTWQAGVANTLNLTGTFADPQNQKLTYTFTQADGSALPYWLHFSFNQTTDVMTATPKLGNLSLAATEALNATQWAEYGLKPLTVEITAHDTSGLVAHETFTLNFTNVPLVGVQG